MASSPGDPLDEPTEVQAEPSASAGFDPTVVEGPPRSLVDPNAQHLAAVPGFRERYEPGKVLGQGGMGRVCIYQDRQIGRRVALKTMREDVPWRAEQRARFLREARVQGQLEHPAVVPVYDLGLDHEGRPFFTMRRVRGLTLEEILERLQAGSPRAFREQHSRRRLLTAFGRLCLAVDYAHEHGVLHRDLKPANIMFGEFGELYLLDWGVAAVLDEPSPRSLENVSAVRATMPGAVIGSAGYLSPEQARGLVDELGTATDVYALGAILFEILTLAPLNYGRTAIERLDITLRHRSNHRVASARAPEQKIAPELDRIVLRATETDPEKRYPSARALQEDLERYLDAQRDEDDRRERAEQQARVAAAAWAEISRSAPDVEAQRRAAQTALGALALDANNRLAADTFTEVVTHVPDVLPREVEGMLERAEHGRLRWMATITATSYAAAFVYLPLLVAAGVARWPALVFTYALLLCAGGLSLVVARATRPSRALALAAMLTSTVACSSTASLFGPLFVTPALVALNMVPYALHLDAGGRRLALVLGVLAVLSVAGLSWGGLVPPLAGDGDGALLLHSTALLLRPLATSGLLVAVALGQVVALFFSGARMRADLAAAERAAAMQGWLLRSLVGRTPGSEPPPAVGRDHAGR